MTLMLALTPELEAQLRAQAKERGVNLQDYALTLLQTLTGVSAQPGADRQAILANAMRMYDLRLVSLGTVGETWP